MDTRRTLSRKEAANRLGISYDRVRHLEGRLLTVQYDENKRPRFFVDDVLRLRNDPRLHPPNRRAAFKDLDNGARVVDLVLKYGITVERALEYQTTYARAVGGVVVPGVDLEELRAFGFFGNGEITARQIVDCLKNALHVLRKHRKNARKKAA